MRMDEAFCNHLKYLYNKNVLEYAQIARYETESKIPFIEGRSRAYEELRMFKIMLTF